MRGGYEVGVQKSSWAGGLLQKEGRRVVATILREESEQW